LAGQHYLGQGGDSLPVPQGSVGLPQPGPDTPEVTAPPGSLEEGIPGLGRSSPPEVELSQAEVGFRIVGKPSRGLLVGYDGRRPGIGAQGITLV